MKDLLTSGDFRGAGIPLRDSAGRLLGPARMGQIPLSAPATAKAPLSAAAQQPVGLKGPVGALAVACQNLDRAKMTAQQIEATYQKLAGLIGMAGATQALEQATDALEAAADRYEEARRRTGVADR